MNPRRTAFRDRLGAVLRVELAEDVLDVNLTVSSVRPMRCAISPLVSPVAISEITPSRAESARCAVCWANVAEQFKHIIAKVCKYFIS